MARRITVEMLENAVSRVEPLFEDGDILSADVMTHMHKMYINTKAKCALTKNLSKVKGLVDYEYVCPVCGKPHIHKLSSARFFNNPLSFGMKNEEPIEYERDGVMRPTLVRLLYCVMSEYEKLQTLCEPCLDKVREVWRVRFEEFRHADKRAYWLELLKGKTQQEIHNIIWRHPFGRYFDNPSLDFKDDVLVDIKCIKDSLQNGKEWIDPIKEAELNRKKEIYEKAYQAERAKAEIKQIEEMARKNARQDVYKENLTETDRFILKYCKPSANDATQEDIRCVLNTEGLNEPQLQMSLRAMLYDDFLNTIYWKVICMRRKYLDDCKCTICGSGKKLHVHHVTYNHHGDERHHFEDMLTVCKKCHDDIHRKEGIIRPK